MRALITCEFSGVVRDQFAALGHDAWSCDLLPTEMPGQHIQGDLRKVIEWGCWDFIGFHTDCTFMCNSGVRWLKTEPGRMEKLEAACELFNLCLRHPAKGYLENPIPHRYAVERIDRKYDQIIQPWMFGHGEIKATCLWLKDVPKLVPTNVVDGREPRVHHASPGPDRWKERSRTLEGVAKAMAEQWGG
jgi:hypothetical protein